MKLNWMIRAGLISAALWTQIPTIQAAELPGAQAADSPYQLCPPWDDDECSCPDPTLICRLR
ncbi:hypothetical protein [Pandoraea sputorum]|uniref:hypothetical protein n=1 Tax=Pandoraea sputorum TaxID=93222 RepID=UPI00123F5A3E|nr:hypothetical protein [Pandoraea sputorum]BET10895.1 hypothetical protein THI4931_19370 [Pandoraea sputorum]VVE82822.1 hypothetical protein PSP31120_03793 [Pandoraea sputorum]